MCKEIKFTASVQAIRNENVFVKKVYTNVSYISLSYIDVVALQNPLCVTFRLNFGALAKKEPFFFSEILITFKQLHYYKRSIILFRVK